MRSPQLQQALGALTGALQVRSGLSHVLLTRECSRELFMAWVPPCALFVERRIRRTCFFSCLIRSIEAAFVLCTSAARTVVLSLQRMHVPCL